MVPDHSGSITPPAGSDFRSQLLLRVTWSGVGGPPENPDRRLATSELQKPVAIQRDITAALAVVQHCGGPPMTDDTQPKIRPADPLMTMTNWIGTVLVFQASINFSIVKLQATSRNSTVRATAVEALNNIFKS